MSPYALVEGAPTWVGVDVALKRDTSAVVAVQERDDGRHHAACRIWSPTSDHAVDATDIMAYLREIDRTYDLQAVSYDPRFFDVPAKSESLSPYPCDRRISTMSLPEITTIGCPSDLNSA